MKKRMFLRWMILVTIALSFLFGCGGKGKDVKKIEGDPEILYKQGLTRFNKRDYPEALKKFEELKSSFPDSPPYTLLAELKVGDCHFLQKQYVEAIAAYEEFKKTHPSHEEIPYVQFQIGMSYFNQMLTLDRDQASTKKALSSFEYLIANYPPSLFSEKGREKIGVCKKRLADHEFYIGNYYYKQGRFQSAASRFEEVLMKFPKDPDEDKTLYFLGKSYLELEQWDKAEAAFRKIVTEYPKSRHYVEAKTILDKGLAERKVSPRKAKAKGSEIKNEVAGKELDRVALVKFEEEGKRPVSLKDEDKAELKKEEKRLTPSPITSETAKEILPQEKAEKPLQPMVIEPVQEDRSQAIPLFKEAKKGDPLPTSSFPPSGLATPETRVKPAEEKRTAVLPGSATPSKEKEGVKKGVIPETKEAKLADKGQPIDITSDKVEAFWKENLIIFKGNVVARQKDMVIYADSIEAVTIEDGKGIERVTAGGNVKIQQGLRVANCEKAIFYNLDQKVVLTGDPKVSEGENIVSGDEIIVDIDKNRVEVKGGSSGRGKAKIQPDEIEKIQPGEIEKLK
jgi:outer membrane protein assembly factor BamD